MWVDVRAGVATDNLYSHTSAVMMRLTTSPTKMVSRLSTTDSAWFFEIIKLGRIH
jgi:hypothetical protein